MSSVSTNPDIAESPSRLGTNTAPAALKYVPLPAPLPDISPNAVRRIVSEDEHPPCRRCLLDARPGEELILIAYDPFPSDSITPYRGAGPIFVHAHSCSLSAGDFIPETQLKRLLSVRVYDEKHLMIGAEVIPGTELEAVGGRMMAEKGASYAHVHNAKPGCFAFRMESV